MITGPRSAWTGLSDRQLLDQCAVDTYRASGPGGQKRNKTSSAVRIRHLPSGLIVIAEESRSQHENRQRALNRLRQALYLQIREPLPQEARGPDGLRALLAKADCLRADGRLDIGRKDARFWPAVGLVLDVFEALRGHVRETASALGVNSANLVQFLAAERKVWEQANHVRAHFGLKLLRD